MAGYTDLAFRLLCIEHGADVVTTEMISAKGLVYGAAATHALLFSRAEEQPLAVQLFGREPAILAEAAKICEGALGPGLRAIDLNLGCPAKKITGNGEGSALMREPLLVGRIVEALAKAAGVPVTVKCRSGWDAAHENAVEIARIAESSGAAMITLHARTRDRFYGGQADWSMIARVKDALNIPVIGNGDIRSGADALRMIEETRCDGVAVGRAALGNPWVFAEIRAARTGESYMPPSEAQRRQAALKHAHMALAFKGPQAIVELRKHIAWYIRGVPGANLLRQRVNAAKSLDELSEILT
jgi:tRNA-dihydrouridine synthase B